MKSKNDKICLYACLVIILIALMVVLYCAVKSCNKQESKGDIAVTISISSYQTNATLTINDDTADIKNFTYDGGGVVGTIYLNQGDKIEINITNGDRPLKIYSYTEDTMPEVNNMTIEYESGWDNISSYTYTLKMDDNIKGYYISIIPEAM